MEMDLSFYSKINMEDDEKTSSDLPLNIGGTSVKAGYIKSKNFIIPQKELDNIAKTLKEGIDGTGAYILKDHGYRGAGFLVFKSVDALAGKINNAWIDGKHVSYTGRIEDGDLAHKLRRNLVSTSSAGLRVERVYCSICGKDYGTCNHRLGEQYPDEQLHESVQDYIEEMDGIPTAALVGENIRAMEQSVVLFPAIPAASAHPLGLEFAEDAAALIEEIEENKNDTCVSCELDEDDIVEKLSKIIEERVTFNKQVLLINERKEMSEEKISELEAKVSSLIAQKEGLDNTVTDLNEKLNTANEIINRYKADEEARHKIWKDSVINELVSLRKDLGLPVKDYAELSDDVLKSDLEVLNNVSTISGTKGKVSDDTNTRDVAKAEWKKKIFGNR